MCEYNHKRLAPIGNKVAQPPIHGTLRVEVTKLSLRYESKFPENGTSVVLVKSTWPDARK